MSDLEIDRAYGRGDKGKRVKLIQEWLTLHGFSLVIDGDFGPATESAVKGFQMRVGVATNGVVNSVTFELLIAPMQSALKRLSAGGLGLGELVVAYAEQHLAQHPREVGGQNRGPWVRLYMGGNEGPEWPWCAGFVCRCLRQACETLATRMPITASYSCDFLAASAMEKGRFVREPSPAERLSVTPGSLFLNRRTPTDWVHTGVVIRCDPEVFYTIEGNTNDDGNREGFEVCARLRGYDKKDFILI